MYNQFDYSITQPALKRQRSNTAISYDVYPTATKSNNQTDGGVVMEGSHHERSKSVAAELIELDSTSDEFMYNMWMLEGATPTPTEEIYDNRQQLKSHPSYNNNMSFLSPQPPPQPAQPAPPPPAPPQQELNNNNGVTKLPLPQISKQTSMLSKRWLTSAQAQKTNNIFFHSEVQTLHYQTPPLVNFDTNTSFPMVGLNVIQEVDQNTNNNLMYSTSHRASIISDHSGSSSTGGSGHHLLSANNVVNSSSASTEETTDAVAVWASTAVSFPKMNSSRQYNNSTTASNSSSLDESSDRVPPPLYQQQQGTSNNSGTVHWINSEKVGDEEYWVD
ncbi:hypothetical protein EDC94DRAFT_617480 [Helicostylum pulchrum]|nr:hypothetical protein EDC94DRAFT_617480 [Helicostylum pulchrum]